MSTLPLREIVACILKEFESANIAVEISREHWRQIYESSPLLKEFSPSRVRVAEADVSIPVAVESIEKPTKKTATLTPQQVLRVLPVSIPIEERERGATEIVSELSRQKKHSFENPNLPKDLQNLLKQRFPRENLADATKAVENLREDFLKNPDVESETRFVYQTAELEKINSDRIMRLNLKITVD